MNADEERINATTEAVIGCAFKVHNELMCGFAEKVYENALRFELIEAGFEVQQQASIVVRYRGVAVGEYIADLIVNQMVLVDIKAIRALEDAHFAQCLNYMAATSMSICLIINLGRRVEVRRLKGKTN